MKPYIVKFNDPNEDAINLMKKILEPDYDSTRASLAGPKSHIWFSAKGRDFPATQVIREAAAEADLSVDEILSTGYKRME